MDADALFTDEYVLPFEGSKSLPPVLVQLVEAVESPNASVLDQQQCYLAFRAQAYPHSIARGYARCSIDKLIYWAEKSPAFARQMKVAEEHAQEWWKLRLRELALTGLGTTAVIVALKMTGQFVDTPGMTINNNQLNIQGGAPNRPEKAMTVAELRAAIALMGRNVVDGKATPLPALGDGSSAS